MIFHCKIDGFPSELCHDAMHKLNSVRKNDSRSNETCTEHMQLLGRLRRPNILIRKRENVSMYLVFGVIYIHISVRAKVAYVNLNNFWSVDYAQLQGDTKQLSAIEFLNGMSATTLLNWVFFNIFSQLRVIYTYIMV